MLKPLASFPCGLVALVRDPDFPNEALALVHGETARAGSCPGQVQDNQEFVGLHTSDGGVTWDEFGEMSHPVFGVAFLGMVRQSCADSMLQDR